MTQTLISSSAEEIANNPLLHKLFFEAIFPQERSFAGNTAIDEQILIATRAQNFTNMHIALIKGCMSLHVDAIASLLSSQSKYSHILKDHTLENKKYYNNEIQKAKVRAIEQGDKTTLAMVILEQILVEHFLNTEGVLGKQTYHLAKDSALYLSLAAPTTAIDINAMPEDGIYQRPILSLMLEFVEQYPQLQAIISDLLLIYPEAYCFAKFIDEEEKHKYWTTIAKFWQEKNLDKIITFQEMALLNHEPELLQFINELQISTASLNKNLSYETLCEHFIIAFKEQDLGFIEEINQHENFQTYRYLFLDIVDYLEDIFRLQKDPNLVAKEQSTYNESELDTTLLRKEEIQLEKERIRKLAAQLPINNLLEEQVKKLAKQLKGLRNIIHNKINSLSAQQDFEKILNQIEADGNLAFLENAYLAEDSHIQTTTLLLDAIKANLPNIVRLLISKNVKVDYCIHGLTGVNISHKTGSFYSPLFLAALSVRSTEITSLLLKTGIDPNRLSLEGNTILHEAIESYDIRMIEVLLQCEEIDINIKDAAGHSAIEHALLRHMNSEIMGLLYAKQKHDQEKQKAAQELLETFLNSDVTLQLNPYVTLQPNPDVTLQLNPVEVLRLNSNEELPTTDELQTQTALVATEPDIAEEAATASEKAATASEETDIFSLRIPIDPVSATIPSRSTAAKPSSNNTLSLATTVTALAALSFALIAGITVPFAINRAISTAIPIIFAALAVSTIAIDIAIGIYAAVGKDKYSPLIIDKSSVATFLEPENINPIISKKAITVDNEIMLKEPFLL